MILRAHDMQRRTLLHTLLQELPSEFSALVRRMAEQEGIALRDREELDETFRQELEAEFRKWKVQPYQALPVSRNPSTGRNLANLAPTSSTDPFFRQYRWSAVRGEYGRLRAIGTATPSDQWSVPGIFDVYGSYSNFSDVLHRAGSMILLQSYRTVTAVSVLDQKIKWSRTMTSGSSSTFSSRSGNSFEEFVAGRDRLPSNFSASLVRIVGAGPGWLCIKNRSKLEVINLLSGDAEWFVELPTEYSQIIATNQLVIASGAAVNQPLCFDLTFGRPIRSGTRRAWRPAPSGMRGICSFAGRIRKTINPSSLQWVDPLNDIVVREIPMTDMKRFQFLDDETLVGFNDKGADADRQHVDWRHQEMFADD